MCQSGNPNLFSCLVRSGSGSPPTVASCRFSDRYGRAQLRRQVALFQRVSIYYWVNNHILLKLRGGI